MNDLTNELISCTNVRIFAFSHDIHDLIQLKNYLDDIYFNTGSSTVSDQKYDELVTCINSITHMEPKIGHNVKDDRKTKLPFFLGGTDKITPDEKNKLDRWLTKNKTVDYIVSDKLDGVSGLFTKNDKLLR